ncbi:MAG: KUP/HAK/KT family potassium transporter [Arachnia sp.]
MGGGTGTTAPGASQHRTGRRGVAAIAALGVVFGDIGTSPLYAFRAALDPTANPAVERSAVPILGLTSLIVWAIVLVVLIQYVAFIMRADNDGEGGVMALVSLIVKGRRHGRGRGALVVLGVLGASLFLGDSLITPAISVLSAVEGLEQVDPALVPWVVPLSLVIVVSLFALQRLGTTIVAGLFGPVMLLWFGTIGVLGVVSIAAHPAVLGALSPSYAVRFFAQDPFTAFVALGAVVLAVTGAEALYADLGHFGAAPIRSAWLVIVFPALVANYLGQASLVLRSPAAGNNPFFGMLPAGWVLPMVVLATLATIIASQAVISGTFSLVRQAIRLEYLPRLNIQHTSDQDLGRVYLPMVNAALAVGVVILIVAFESSTGLAGAYGIAVTGTMSITGMLFLFHAWSRGGPRNRLVAAAMAVLLLVDLTFLSANLLKIPSGGWVPLVVAACVFAVMANWHSGRRRIRESMTARPVSLGTFFDHIAHAQPPVQRVPGVALFVTRAEESTPWAMRAMAEQLLALPHDVVVITVAVLERPHVGPLDRGELVVHATGGGPVAVLQLRFGFNDHQALPLTIQRLLTPILSTSELQRASYVVSTFTFEVDEGATRQRRWRQQLYIWTARWGVDPIRYHDLPPNRTILMGHSMQLP